MSIEIDLSYRLVCQLWPLCIDCSLVVNRQSYDHMSDGYDRYCLYDICVPMLCVTEFRLTQIKRQFMEEPKSQIMQGECKVNFKNPTNY